MSGKGYEFFEHTADVGLHVSGVTLEDLFVHAAQGLFELLVEDSPEDYEVTLRSLRRAGYTQQLHHCQSGDDALARLRSSPRP